MSPFFALSATPSTSMLTRSSAMWTVLRSRPSGGLRSQGVADQAAPAVVDHVFELVAIVLQETLHRPGRGITEGADRVTLDAVGDVEQQAELLAARLTVEHA